MRHAAMASAFATIALVACGPAPDPPGTGGLAPAKNIILFIGDGLQLENEIAASRYLTGTDRGLAWHSFPCQAFVATWSVDSYNAYAADLGAAPYEELTFDPLVGYDPSRGGIAPYPVSTEGSVPYLLRAATDSAAAATAMATGVKTDNGNIAWLRGDPHGGALTTVAELMRGLRAARIGVVTNMPFNHATPACFVSHNASRTDYAAIADEIVNTTVPDVVIGAGHPDWSGSAYFTEEQLAALRASSAYVLVERTAGRDGGAALEGAAVDLAAGKKLFGLFGGPTGPMEPPAPKDQPGHPAFERETENPSLADATLSALTVLRRGRGFFLMVEAGTIDLANSDNDLAGTVGALWDLDQAVTAALAYVERPGDAIDWTNTLLIVTCDHVTGGLRLDDTVVPGPGDIPDAAGYRFATRSHTNELVTLYAKGAGSDGFLRRQGIRYAGAAILDNTQIFEAMAAAAGIR